MQPGRTPIWNLVADLSPSAWLEPARIGTDGRVLLPIQLRKRLTWGESSASQKALAVIGKDGAAVVRPFDEAKQEIASLAGLLGSAGEATRAQLTLSAMATYSQVTLQPDGRLRLPPLLALHLQPEKDARIWMASFEDRLHLWPEAAWAVSLQSGLEMLHEQIGTELS